MFVINMAFLINMYYNWNLPFAVAPWWAAVPTFETAGVFCIEQMVAVYREFL
jgi:hypothetical protein